MTPIALPATIVHALRDPAPNAQDFTPTRFQPASNKAAFALHFLRFISCDCPRHQFTLRFYRQLIHCFGYIAFYDLDGFWTEFFSTPAGKVEFIEQALAWPCYGEPTTTWSDVEREIIGRLRRTELLSIYRQRLNADQDAVDRAELARLLVKYGQDATDADPGTLPAVLVPMSRPVPAKPQPRWDGNSQLTLGLG